MTGSVELPRSAVLGLAVLGLAVLGLAVLGLVGRASIAPVIARTA